MTQVPQSLWGLVEEHVQPPERAEVKRILGEDVVDLSLELRAEVEILEALLEEERKAGCPSSASSPVPCSLLTPPPPMRDLVRGELRLLLLSLRHKAELEGRDSAKAWACYSPRVLHFALGDPWDSVGGELEAQLPGSPGLRSLSRLRNCSPDFSAIKDCLNVANIDRVIHHLRTLLKEECHALEREIKALQHRLEDAHSSAAEPPVMMLEPTLAELKEQKRAMKQELLEPLIPRSLCQSSWRNKPPAASQQGLGRQRMYSGKGQELPFSGQQPQEPKTCSLLPPLTPSHTPIPPQPRASGTSYHQNRWGRRLQCHPCKGPLTSAGPHTGTPS
ncbi:coiled-coil domain-containing protein 24 [Gracilinanus agilis]|uniref:coiled-coil domain-containing protein 24 n=1 Tax=Gracilinanus agilis TaxID=191870 RepID=UPI001CFCFDAA|nr:coiled-coil domain-containing protein 24 [Gracilinanus agilis]